MQLRSILNSNVTIKIQRDQSGCATNLPIVLPKLCFLPLAPMDLIDLIYVSLRMLKYSNSPHYHKHYLGRCVSQHDCASGLCSTIAHQSQCTVQPAYAADWSHSRLAGGRHCRICEFAWQNSIPNATSNFIGVVSDANRNLVMA